MGAELKVYEEVGCAGETEIRYQNVTLAAVTDAVIIAKPNSDAGNAVADEYTLDIAYDSGNTEWDCDVTRLDGSQYHVDGIINDGDNDGNILPGITITLDDLNTSNSYQSIIYVGYNPGTIVAGSNSSDKHLWVKNIGDASGTDARIVILPDGKFENTTNTPIKALDETKLTKTVPLGTYEITVKADTTKVDVVYEGNDPYEKTISDDGSTPDLIADGLYAVFDPDVVQNDEATIIVSDGKNRARIAEDDSGSPDTFGTADVVLGNMNVNDVESFWVRIETNAGDSPEGNPRRANLQARITTI
jgi:hypothetical protein